MDFCGAKIQLYDKTERKKDVYLTKPRGIQVYFLTKPRGITDHESLQPLACSPCPLRGLWGWPHSESASLLCI